MLGRTVWCSRSYDKEADMTGSAKAPCALITGASTGLGVEFARQLAKRGYDVVLVARRRERLEAIAGELRAQGAQAFTIVADLSAPNAAHALLGEVDRMGLEPDLLVNNAGTGLYGSATDLPPEAVETMLRLNVVTLTQLALALGRRMAERGFGEIINVSSTASFQPDPWLAAYGASKAYVTSFSLALAEELGPRGVRVLTHCPGLTRTEFNEVAGVRAARDANWMYMSPEACVAAALGGIDRRRRFVVPGVFNRVVAFIARRAPLLLLTRINAWLLAPAAGATSAPHRLGRPPLS